ncbi:MAG: V-type ATP synthase subunit D [Verrucomicrobia bacterium]|nr:V-type ATP synthase subunit D [Verrucomicrobiota bacterium]
MAQKIKHTKNELKTQRESLKRYERFLPMLQLKKQQLQVEIQSITVQVEAVIKREAATRDTLDTWIKMISEPIDIESLIQLKKVSLSTGNIAGVEIPVLNDVQLRISKVDLYTSPAWLDDATKTLGDLIRMKIEREVLEEQRKRITEELRITNQRVNLFEKVKIPECKENIRMIRIFLGDEQTAGVARGKIAKRRSAD